MSRRRIFIPAGYTSCCRAISMRLRRTVPVRRLDCAPATLSARRRALHATSTSTIRWRSSRKIRYFLNLNVAYGRKLTFTGFYIYSKANSDTGGPGYHPSNQYDIMQDYGRQFFDVRNRVFAFANYSAPYGFRISPFLSASSGAPFNIQLSQDMNGDSFFNDRPIFASSASNPATVDTTKYGNFDISPTPPARLEADSDQLWERPGSVCDEYARGQELWRRPARGGRQRGGRGRGWRWPGGGGHGGMPGMGLGGTGGGPHGPDEPRRSSIQHYVERLCAQYFQCGESCAAKWNAGRASGWDY